MDLIKKKISKWNFPKKIGHALLQYSRFLLYFHGVINYL
jgi:hypothetical protein